MKRLVAMVVVLISFGFASSQQHITSHLKKPLASGWSPQLFDNSLLYSSSKAVTLDGRFAQLDAPAANRTKL
jgi:hypothetical protein